MGYHPSLDWSPRAISRRFRLNSVLKTLQKKSLNPIDKLDLIRYIYNISNKETTYDLL